MTLLARARDSHAPHSILNDQAADKIAGSLDYDVEKLKMFGSGDGLLVVRARQYDEWLRAFLVAEAPAIVLNLGCGLDTRVSRIAPGPEVDWYDVDFPDVIALRENFFDARPGYTMIAAPLTDSDWLSQVPDDRPAAIIADGVLEYLAEEDVRALIGRLVAHFPRGEMMFDVMNTFAVNSAKKQLRAATGAEHRWSVDDLRTVDAFDPSLKRLAGFSIFRSPFIRALPWKSRLLYGALAMVPPFSGMIRLARYAFGLA